MWGALVEFRNLWWHGFVTTGGLLAIVMLVGIPGGVLLGVLGARKFSWLASFIRAAKGITKVIPMLVLLFWLHFPLQAALNIVVDPFWTTVVALGGVNLVAVAYMMQSELLQLPPQYRETALTLGLSNREIVRHIELPMLFRRLLPTVALQQAVMLEYTLFASLIGVPELFRVAQSINAMIYDPVAVYSLLVIFFVIMLAPLHSLIAYMRSRHMFHYA